MSDELLEYSAQRNQISASSGEAGERPAKSGGLNRLSTIFLVVLGLHVVFPLRGEIVPSLYFAMLIVTCSPTANNINVMAEVSYMMN